MLRPNGEISTNTWTDTVISFFKLKKPRLLRGFLYTKKSRLREIKFLVGIELRPQVGSLTLAARGPASRFLPFGLSPSNKNIAAAFES